MCSGTAARRHSNPSVQSFSNNIRFTVRSCWAAMSSTRKELEDCPSSPSTYRQGSSVMQPCCSCGPRAFGRNTYTPAPERVLVTTALAVVASSGHRGASAGHRVGSLGGRGPLARCRAIVLLSMLAHTIPALRATGSPTQRTFPDRPPLPGQQRSVAQRSLFLWAAPQTYAILERVVTLPSHPSRTCNAILGAQPTASRTALASNRSRREIEPWQRTRDHGGVNGGTPTSSPAFTLDVAGVRGRSKISTAAVLLKPRLRAHANIAASSTPSLPQHRR